MLCATQPRIQPTHLQLEAVQLAAPGQETWLLEGALCRLAGCQHVHLHEAARKHPGQLALLLLLTLLRSWQARKGRRPSLCCCRCYRCSSTQRLLPHQQRHHRQPAGSRLLRFAGRHWARLHGRRQRLCSGRGGKGVLHCCLLLAGGRGKRIQDVAAVRDLRSVGRAQRVAQ